MARILLIEDEAVLRSNIARALGRLPGMEVLDAGSVDEAIALLARGKPDLVVSDIDLPRRTGIEMLGELGSRGLHVPIVFVTGYLRAYASQIPRHANIEVLEKPLAIDELRAVVERHLRSSARSSSELAPFGVADYMQLAGMGRHSVLIELATDDRRVGTVCMVNGEAWSAEDERGTGPDALRRLAFLDDAVVTCRTLVGDAGPRTLDGRWEWVLMEAARLEDESHRLESDPAPGLPPPPMETAAERAARAFERAWDEGIEALLRKDYGKALEAFLRAREFAPEDTKVAANLRRLAQLGYVPPGDVGAKEVAR